MPTEKQSTASLTLLALGVVFGDIGTSPLYAVKETFSPGHGIALEDANILAGASIIFWSLMVVVSLKYVVLIMRADNRGEGGVMALIALAQGAIRDRPRWRTPLLLIGCFGAALFYGDAVLTPAISVLSAVEGLEIATSALKPYVVPVAVGVLLALFALQARGTATIGRLFGPVTMAWFLAIGAAGIYGILRQPAILAALNPMHALGFLTSHAAESFVVLGSVVLAVTGAEALYADMGHFGKGPVRIAWFALVAPALVLNYLGQGALLMLEPEAVRNPFYLLLPGWALYPMIALATAATVIASQAVISGAYSITRQAIQLGFLPRMAIVHTSAKEIGQVYLPLINWLLCAAVIAAVVGFGSSSRLAAAYGVAVTATMLVDTLLTFFVIRYSWNYPLALCVAATGFFIVIDLAFFGATLLKVADGGWFPLVIGAVMFAVMTTWRRGREMLFARLNEHAVPLEPFLKSLFRDPPQRVPGTAVFLTSTPAATPHALLHSLKQLQGASRAQRLPDGGVSRRADRGVRGSGGVRAHRQRMLARVGALRIHEPAGRRPGARPLRPVRPADRPDGGLLLPVQGKDHPGRAARRHGALARQRLRGHGAQRRQRHGLFQHSAQPGRGARHAHRHLSPLG
jgi:KUP system potassium uptake protein